MLRDFHLPPVVTNIMWGESIGDCIEIIWYHETISIKGDILWEKGKHIEMEIWMETWLLLAFDEDY